MSIADRVHTLTLEALNTCTDAQRVMFMRVHGLTTEHATTEEAAAEVARDLGITRATGHSRLLAARAAVYQHIAATFTHELMQAENDAAFPLPGITTLEHTDGTRSNDPSIIAVGLRVSGAASWERIDLGAGTRAMENAEKSQHRSATPLRAAVHQAHSRTQSAA